MKKTAVFLLGIFLMISVTGPSGASTLGTDITIFDQNSANQGWHRQGENNEVEPGMEHGQKWDMEAFFVNGTTLSMVGGFDFVNGQSGVRAGDIFIDVNNDAVFGDIHGNLNGNRTVDNTFGYDYVLDMNFSTSTYNVLRIDANSQVTTSYYKQNQGSNPWIYESGGEVLWENLDFSYISYNPNSTEADALYLRSLFGKDRRNVVGGLDLSFLGDDIYGAIIHSTMGCGNDNLMAQVSPVPEPATLLLFGAGLLGIARFKRRKAKN